jgi:hypothetical protein
MGEILRALLAASGRGMPTDAIVQQLLPNCDNSTACRQITLPVASPYQSSLSLS